MKAAQLFTQGVTQAEVARQLGVSRTAVHYWYSTWEKKGTDGLRGIPTGRKPRLTERQWKKAERLLLRGPQRAGYNTDLWTLPRIAAVIRHATGVGYATGSGVWKLLRRFNWSCQKPQPRARERNEAAITEWKQRIWPQIQKKGCE